MLTFVHSSVKVLIELTLILLSKRSRFTVCQFPFQLTLANLLVNYASHGESNEIYDYPFWAIGFFEGCLKLRIPNYRIRTSESNAYRNNLFNYPSFEKSPLGGVVQWFMIDIDSMSFEKKE